MNHCVAGWVQFIYQSCNKAIKGFSIYTVIWCVVCLVCVSVINWFSFGDEFVKIRLRFICCRYCCRRSSYCSRFWSVFHMQRAYCSRSIPTVYVQCTMCACIARLIVFNINSPPCLFAKPDNVRHSFVFSSS